jgi:hypothetical protein
VTTVPSASNLDGLSSGAVIVISLFLVLIVMTITPNVINPNSDAATIVRRDAHGGRRAVTATGAISFAVAFSGNSIRLSDLDSASCG